MKSYKKSYRYINKLFRNTFITFTSVDVTTFVIIGAVLVTVVYLV